jgi:hypothetical protein
MPGMRGAYRLRSVHGEQQLQPIVHELRVVELPLGELQPRTAYSLEYGGYIMSSFTTGSATDHSPPPPPRFIGANASPSSIWLLLTSSYDAAMVELTVHHGDGTAKTIVAPEATLRDFGTECAGLDIGSTELVCFDAVEIDPAGNRGPAVRQCDGLDPLAWVRYLEPVDEPISPWPLISLLAVVSAISALFIVLVRNTSAADAFARATHDPIDAELVRRAAERQRTRALMTLAGCATALLLLAYSPEPIPLAIFGMAPFIAGLVATATLRRARQVIRKLEQPDSNPSYDGQRYLFAGQHHWLALSPGQLERVTKAAVPTAKIR